MSFANKQEEDDAVACLTVDGQPNDRYSYWIGFTDQKNEGTWVWSDGRPTNWTNWSCDYCYTAGRVFDCAWMTINLGYWVHWRNAGCFNKWQFVCKV